MTDIDKAWAYLRQTKSAGANLKVWPPTDKNSYWYKAGVELGVIQTPPPPPSGAFGSLLPTNPPASAGSEVQVSSFAQLKAAANNAPLGSRIRLTQQIDGGGDQFLWYRSGAPNLVTTLTGAKLRNCRVYSAGNAPLRVALEIEGVRDNCVKTDPPGRIILDKGAFLHHSKGSGFMCNADWWQVWDTLIEDCGTDTNQDHGIYADNAKPGCVIANAIIRRSQAFNIQIQTSCDRVIVTHVTLEGGKTRGGMVFASTGTKDCVVVGAAISGAPGPPVDIDPWKGVPSGIKVYDSAQWSNGASWDTAYGNAVAQYINSGSSATHKIDPARYGYVPAKDFNGVARDPAGVRVGAVVA